MNFGKFSSVLFTFVQDDCHSRSRQGHVGKRGVGEGGNGGGGQCLSRQYVMMKKLEKLLLDKFVTVLLTDSIVCEKARHL